MRSKRCAVQNQGITLTNLIIHTFQICVLGIFTAAFDTQIEWLIVKGIADYADCAQLTSEGWDSCASVTAASLVTHILSDPVVFHSWPHYQGSNLVGKFFPAYFIMACYHFALFTRMLILLCLKDFW